MLAVWLEAQAARDSNGDEAAWRLKPCPSLMFVNGAGVTGHSYRSAQTIVKHYRARNADRADSGIDRLELQVRKEGMKG